MKKGMGIDSNEPYLPPEIITNILKRLPVKSLIRFQCVCKDWKSLFKTQLFISEHFRYSTHQNPCLIFKCSGCKCNPRHLCLMNRYMQILEHPTLPFTDSSMGNNCKLVGSSNGLLCLQFMRHKSYMLWNPAIREVFQVPEFKVLNFPRFGILSYVGFGFSPIANDCKIVRLLVSWRRDDRFYLVIVFSLSTGSWKELEVGKLEGIKAFTDESGFAFDGAIFWFGFIHLETNELCILSFDIATEAFTLIPFPRSAVSYENRLTTYENKLAMLSSNMIRKTSSSSIPLLVFNLWVMEKCIDTSGERWNWTKIYTSNPYPHCACLLSPPSIWKNEIFWESDAFRLYFGEATADNYEETVDSDEETVDSDEEAVDDVEEKLVLCHLHTNEFKMLASSEPLVLTKVCNYAESFVSFCNIHIGASSS